MAKKKLVEHNALVQAIEMGTPKNEVMEKFGIKTPAALKTAYLNALIALEKVRPMKNKRTRKKKKVSNIVQINSRGSLVIPKALVDQLELNGSDAFKVEPNGSGVYLKVVEKPQRTILKKRSD